MPQIKKLFPHNNWWYLKLSLKQDEFILIVREAKICQLQIWQDSLQAKDSLLMTQGSQGVCSPFILCLEVAFPSDQSSVPAQGMYKKSATWRK